MMKITVKITATYQGNQISGECFVVRELEMLVPYGLDPKFHKIPYPLEGVLDQVVTEHKRVVNQSMIQLDKAEREAKDMAQAAKLGLEFPQKGNGAEGKGELKATATPAKKGKKPTFEKVEPETEIPF